MQSDPPVLHICTTCQLNAPLPPDGVAPGTRLMDALAGTPGIELREVKCLALCEAGCAATISSPGKWTYIIGGLRAEMADDIVQYAAAYAASKNGTVLPSRRAPSLARALMGRIPGAGQELPR